MLTLIARRSNVVFLMLLLAATFMLSAAGAQDTAKHSPDLEAVHIGSFDPDAWNGIVFDVSAFGQDLPFAIRFGSKSGRFLDGDQIFDNISLVGPHAPDESYAQMGWCQYPRAATITLEWSRVNNTTIVGRIHGPMDMQYVLEAYSPYQRYFTGEYHLTSNAKQIVGIHYIDNHLDSVLHFIAEIDQPVTGAATFSNVAQLNHVMQAGQLFYNDIESRSGAAGLRFQTDDQYLSGAAGLQFRTGPSETAHFVASVGWATSKLEAESQNWLQPGRIDALLDHRARQYEDERPRIAGLFGDAPTVIGNSMFWNTQYIPSTGLEFPTISRRWSSGFGGWVTGEWDCFFGALLTSVESASQTNDALRAILSSQAPNGIVPNVDGASGTSPDRSEPPIGAFIIWKIFERSHNLPLLEWAYPRLKKWHEFWFRDRGDGQPWRDGNRDGLLEWGSDKGSGYSVGGRGFMQQAKWESGMDDSPMWDDVIYNQHTFTMELDDVGLNSLYALDAECLAKIALILGYKEDSKTFTEDYDHMRALVRKKLWNEQDGIYENRYWDGHFSKELSPTNFYPLLAGIATPAQAHRMITEHLLNKGEFWGQYVMPTISRNDRAFPDQYYWRGDIWGPTNYLVYEGLDRYGFDKIALQFARKSYDLFMSDWHSHQYTDEQYYAWGGSAGGDKHYTWGALLALIPMEQYLDDNPWDGFRFGAFNPSEEGELQNITWNGHKVAVTIGPNDTKLVRDGVERFAANAGVVVRDYSIDSQELSFTIKTPRDVSVRSDEFASGAIALRIDNDQRQTLCVHNGMVSFSLPAGEHNIVLEPKER